MNLLTNYTQYLALLDECKDVDLDMVIAENPMGIEDGEKAVAASSILWLAAHGDIAGIAVECGLSAYGLGQKFDILPRTVQQWTSGSRSAPSYVVQMIGYILITEMTRKNERQF